LRDKSRKDIASINHHNPLVYSGFFQAFSWSKTRIIIVYFIYYTADRRNMLVLSRQKDESIMIGDDIKITIVDVRSNGLHDDAIHLGITAPKHISVHREEIYEAIQREKAEERAAAKNKVMNNRTGNNPVGIDGIDNIDEVQESARTVELVSGIPV